MILNPSRTHTTFGKTPQISEQPLNLHSTTLYRNTIVKREMIEYTWVQSQIEVKRIQSNRIPLVEKYPKVEAILEKLFWIITTYLYSKQLLKAFNARAKTILNQIKSTYPNFVNIFKISTDWKHETISWIGLNAKSTNFKILSNPFQNTLTVKQPLESKFQQVDFPLSLENISFSKRTWIKQP